MHRVNRMFEIIQLLRASGRPVRAENLAEQLEVSKRTIYRDVSALQAMRIPIDGEAGVGYMMRRGYDLPPLNFDSEEVEALRVGLAMLNRTGDSALKKAAERISKKIDALHCADSRIQVAPWGAPLDDPDKGCVSKSMVRAAIRNSRKLKILYQCPDKEKSERVIRPLAIIYHLEVVMIAAWCESRGAFRHFRMDRIWDCHEMDEEFSDQAEALLSLWEEQEGFTAEYAGAWAQ